MSEWYDNPELLRAAYEKYGSLAETQRQIGGASASTLQKAWHRHGLQKLTPGPNAKAPNQEALKELYDSIYG